ncbi:MAG: alpha/beta hydrolase [SAR324 cluster bacterium]|nr:alpha/beta hydrolase [SAR324 cluster bacterium]
MTETVLMIHGMWASGALWEKWANYFEDRGFHCLRATLRHHGGDPAAPPHPELGTTSLLDYAQDLEEEIRRLEAPPIIIGHSMGGLLAQMLGARGLARMLVLLTPASPRGIMAIKPSVLRSFWSGMTTWAFWRKALRQTFGEASWSMMHLLTPEEQKEIYSSFGFESGRAAAEIGFWLFDPNRASQVNAKAVTCPTLVVGASEDRICPVSVVRQVAKKYRHVATYQEFPGHAHWVVGEPGWEDIAGFCADWLKERLREEQAGSAA